jgi:hypothetical protein
MQIHYQFRLFEPDHCPEPQRKEPIMTPTTNTSPPVLEARLNHLLDAGPTALNARLRQLDSEWSVGRVVKVTAACFIVLGLLLGLLVNPWWGLLACIPCLTLLQHLVARTSILGEIVHLMGFRRGSEIEQERLALRVLRGDFNHLPTVYDVEDRDALSRFEDEGGPAHEHPQAGKVDAHEAVKQVVDVALR